MNVASLLRARAARHPERIAFVDAAAGSTLSYAALDAASARVAAALRGRGLRPGDTVLIVHPVTLDLYVALIGMLRAGLVPAIPPPGAGLGALARCTLAIPPRAVLAGGSGGRRSRRSRRCAGRCCSRPPPDRSPPISSTPERRRRRARRARRRRSGDAHLHRGSTGAPKALLRSHGVARAQIEGLAARSSRATRSRCARCRSCCSPSSPRARRVCCRGSTCAVPRTPTRRGSPKVMRAHAAARVIASPALLTNLAAALRGARRNPPGAAADRLRRRAGDAAARRRACARSRRTRASSRSTAVPKPNRSRSSMQPASPRPITTRCAPVPACSPASRALGDEVAVVATPNAAPCTARSPPDDAAAAACACRRAPSARSWSRDHRSCRTTSTAPTMRRRRFGPA